MDDFERNLAIAIDKTQDALDNIKLIFRKMKNKRYRDEIMKTNLSIEEKVIKIISNETRKQRNEIETVKTQIERDYGNISKKSGILLLLGSRFGICVTDIVDPTFLERLTAKLDESNQIRNG